MSPRGPTTCSSASPLSSRMDALAVPASSRRCPSRQHTSASSSSLRLPSLPRFHPANFPSQHTSATTTPATGPNSPQPPVSPRSQHSQYSDAQKQLYMYQREMLLSRQPSTTSVKPVSPRLIPMGSPGPVTPLELEDRNGNGGYFLAGSTANAALAGDYVEKLIKEEAKRMAAQTAPRPTSVGGR